MAACHPASVQHDRNLLPFLYILCTGYDLGCSPLFVNGYLAYYQLICIGMFLYFLNPSHYDLIQVGVKFLISLHLRSRHRHRVHIFLFRTLQFRYICFNP